MEPEATAALLLATAAMLMLAALASRLSGRFGVPSLLFFLLLGLVAGLVRGTEATADEHSFAFRLGTAALVLILFDGGVNTPLRAARSVAAPAVVLATAGVVMTAALMAAAARALGLPTGLALLAGAVVSSTDAAAVFSVLRAGGLQLKERVGLTLELESGLNDPMAVFLTFTITDALLSGEGLGLRVVVVLVQQLGLGLAGGVLLGCGGRALLRAAHLPSAGLYPVITSGLALGGFGAVSLVGGSGFLAVYVAAILLGAGPLPYRAGLLRVHDALAWLSQIGMFVMLGYIVSTTELPRHVVAGIALSLVLALVARPAAVWLCLAPFRFARSEVLFTGLAGLRGAVPVILATYPLLRGLDGAGALFHLVFVIVVVTSVLPGAGTAGLARRLGLRRQMPPPAPAGLEVMSLAEYEGEFTSYYVSPASAVAGARVRELPLPEDSLVTMIVRGHEVLAPRGETELRPDDHVYVFIKPADRPFVDLLFGYAEQ